jgi:hypothetical protein
MVNAALHMFSGIPTQAGQITPVGLRQQPFGVQPSSGRDDCRIGGLVDLDPVLGTRQIEADQRIEFIDQIGRKGMTTPC